MEPTIIGIIGCGNISDAYLAGAARSQLLRVKSVADIRAEAVEAAAQKYGVEAMQVDALLADADIEIVVNLTVPAAHAPVNLRIIEAGKHAYLEKPLATRFDEAKPVMQEATAKGLRVGCAPDTFLGAAHQACRYAIDAGLIGVPVAGAASLLSHGMEHWHPNPAFFYQHGGGPIHDMGPYYVTQLVNLLGPVARVTAQASGASPTRTITSEPLAGQAIAVEVPTTVNGVLSFVSGANASLCHSWDVWKHTRAPLEIYGSEGSMLAPDPNFFGGEPRITRRDGDWMPLDIRAHPYGEPNRLTRTGAHVADYRIIGLLDMAAAIRAGRPHRASGMLALHVLEVLDAFERSSIEGCHIAIETPCDRPEKLPLGSGEEVFA
ncbi:MAG TPA: Gfo/Idh/MocA family oxidoreductase [Acetobacteraceae bacterium]|jgi:predicted dehydrogenase|nr:Gfo/Idh/MocA family oxidoreductase [Acetobacteraceae bacterium]